jgi:uncharacterized protein
VVKGKALALSQDAEGNLQRTNQDFTAIPYYAWANRGPGEMAVWIPNTETSGRPRPYPNLTTGAKLTASGKKNPRALNDGDEPQSSNDHDYYFDWWPAKGAKEWVEYAFEKPVTVSETSIYWFDDTGRGQVRVPASWRVLYQDGAEWKPVEGSDPYTSEKDRYNRLAFKPVTTGRLRLEVTMQPQWSAGVERWRVK